MTIIWIEGVVVVILIRRVHKVHLFYGVKSCARRVGELIIKIGF